MSKMVKEYSLEDKNKAMGLLMAGKTLKEISKEMGMAISTLKLWKKKFKRGESLKKKPGQGRPTVVSRVPNIIISKSINKRGQSTRKLAKRLTRSGYSMSHQTVYNHLKKSRKLHAYKPRTIPLLTKKQIENRINWCKKRRNWSIQDWERVIYSDESSFEIFHSKNRQNDQVWADNIENVPTSPSVKFPTKVMFWGAISHQGLTELHFVPEKTMVNARYYVDEILTKSLLPALNRKRNIGSTLQIKLIENMSEAIFCQDGAPCHRAKTTQNWLKDNVGSFWPKEEWPGNSPDLNPIENV